MKRWKLSVAMVGLATGLLLSTLNIRQFMRTVDMKEPAQNKTLKGSYGFYRNGTTSTGPLAALGILFFDGNGNVSGSQSISRNGVFTFDVPIPPVRMRWLRTALPSS